MATQDEIRAVLAATDIVSLIGEDIELRKAGKDFEACCPLHDEKTPSFTVSKDKQFFHCFGCGAHGDAIAWLAEYRRLPFRQALEELAGRAGIALGDNTSGERHARRGRQTTAEIEAALHHYARADGARHRGRRARDVPPDTGGRSRPAHTHPAAARRPARARVRGRAAHRQGHCTHSTGFGHEKRERHTTNGRRINGDQTTST